MAKELNDTQRLILSAAAARDELRALPLPDTLRAPPHVVKKTLARMIMEGLLAEIAALPEDTAWTESEAGGRVTLVVSQVGLAAIGIEPEAAPAGADRPQKPEKTRRGRSKPAGAQPTSRVRNADGATKQSKQDLVLSLLRRPEGASIDEMVKATGWQPHSVRGFLAGAVKRRLGLKVESRKSEGEERRYHVAAPAVDGGEPV